MGSIIRKCGCESVKCGHPWTARYREPGGRNGRQRERSFPLKRDAVAFLAKIDNDKNQGVYLDPQRGAVTVRAWSEQWMAALILAPATRRDYQGALTHHLIPVIGCKTLSQIGAADIQNVVAAMNRAGLKASTIRTRMIPLRSMFTAAVRDKRIASNPCDGVSLPREASHHVDRDALPTLSTVVALSGVMAERYRLAVWLMAGTGLRISEALAITSDCVRGDVLRIWQQTTTNNKDGSQRNGLAPLKHRAAGEYREIPLPEFLADEIAQHIEAYGTATIDGHAGHLFPSATGRFSTTTTHRYSWMSALRALGLVKGDGLPQYTPHDLRHFFASTALAGGVSLVEVSRWLGHRSISITADTYGHLTEDAPDRMRRVMQDALRPPLRVVHSA